MLLKVHHIECKDDIRVPSSYIEMYLKWMEYIPSHWNLEELLNKKASELSNDEIEILKLVQQENKYKDVFKQHLNKDKKFIIIPQDSDINFYTKQMSIEKYAHVKLTEEEIEYCKKIVSKFFTYDEIQIEIAKLEMKKDKNVIEEYILFELNKKSYEAAVRDLNAGIREKVSENRKHDLYGYEKCINTRNRF